MLGNLVDRPVAVTMIISVVVVLGVVCIKRLPVSLIPDLDIPYVTIKASAPNMSASEIEDVLAKPLRSALSQMDGLTDITSDSKDGLLDLKLNFDYDTDISYAFIEANEKVDRVMSSTSSIERPKVMKASASDIPAFYICITGDIPLLELSKYAENIVVKRLEQLEEVAMVDVSGVEHIEIFICPDEEKLRQVGLDLRGFAEVVKSANVKLGNLSIRDGEYHFNVKFNSLAASVKDIEELYFKVGDRLLQVKDVAKVTEIPIKRTGMVTSSGKEAVIMAVIKQKDARMPSLKRSVNNQLDIMARETGDIRFEITRDQTELLDYSIRNLVKNIILGIILASLVVFIFMKDVKSSFLVVLTIPVSLLLSMFIFRLVGISINIISLSGLLLGVGMMVDNSIILVDNISICRSRSKELRIAVLEGTKEVIGPMLSSVLTTCAVFIPLVFLSGIAGKLFHDQALAITIVLFSSFVVTVFVLPVYYYLMYKRQTESCNSGFVTGSSLSKGMKLYERGVRFFLGNSWSSVVLLAICTILAVICLIRMPISRLPEITYKDMIVNVEWNEHIPLEENLRRTEQLRSSVGELASRSTSLIGIQQFALPHCTDNSISGSSVYIDCNQPADLINAREIIEALVESNYPFAEISFEKSGNIFETVFADDKAVVVGHLRPKKDSGIDPELLSWELSRLSSEFPGIINNSPNFKTEAVFISDPELMSVYGVSFQDVTNTLAAAMGGSELFTIVQGDRPVPVVMGTGNKTMADVLETVSFPTSEGGVSIPARDILSLSYVRKMRSITADRGGECFTFDILPDRHKEIEVMKQVRSSVIAAGRFDIDFSGSWEYNRKMEKELLLVLAVAIVLLFLILSAQFESLVKPFIILLEVIIDIAFSLAGLWVFGQSINLMSLIGLIVICGIVVNDSILKVDTINRLRAEGMTVEAAIIEAGHRRLKAIIMTSLTTILAVAPLLTRGSFGDNLQYPMSLVIVIGMTVGTLVSLFVVPALYSMIYKGGK